MSKILKQAFTLIELLVVIAIIGILSGLIVVTMSGATQKAIIARSQVFSNSLRNSLMANLVSEWKFDGSGLNDGDTATTVYTQDNWGSNPVTTIGGTPKVYSGSNCISGSCLYFDGSSSIYSTANSLIPSQAIYTIEGWLKIPSSVSGTTSISFVVLSSSGGLPRFSPCYNTSCKPLLYLSASNFKYGVSDLRDDKWHHIVFVVTGSAAADITNDKIYIDGKIESSGSTSSSAVPTLPNGNLYIGNAFTGYIDGVRIYSEALPTSQIQQQYYLGLNNLLNNGSISKEEYLSRINNLISINE
jgi:prepilin-type N-terminal cleavage/methylation domain-containing protein